ncbi:MAG: response regulator, partial [Oceanihabitans sp.]
ESKGIKGIGLANMRSRINDLDGEFTIESKPNKGTKIIINSLILHKMKSNNILIIDDHPIIIEAYKSALTKITADTNLFDFNIAEAHHIDAAIEIISKNSDSFFDLIFLDIKLPESDKLELHSGEDLGLEIRKMSPKSKIIIATTYNDNYRINNIIKNINPEAFLVKNDITPKVLLDAIVMVLEDSPFYSKSVLNLLRKQIANDISIDKIDRQILYELSIGTKMIDLPNIIPLSIGGIERRKRILKDIFEVPKKDDRTLIKKAKDKGFI